VVNRYEPFPTVHLPEPIRTMVEDGADAIGCDAAYIALPTLAALASAIGNTRRLRLKRTWHEPAILWAAVVGESGTAKSPAMALALQWTKARQDEAVRTHKAAMSDYQHAEQLHAVRHKAWLQRAGHATEPGPDGPPEAPLRPTCERTWTDDATTEALVALLSENPRGLLLATDELSGWFQRMDRYTGGKGGDAAKWLEMFGGRSVVVDRKGSGFVHVPRAAVSVVGSIQPAILQRSVGDTNRENGLLARLLLAHPPRRAREWTDRDLDERTVEAVGAVYARLYGLAMDTNHDGQHNPRTVILTPEARRRFVAFYNAHNAEQVALDGDEAAAWSKLEGYAARFALILHLTRWAAGEPIDPDAVDEPSMEAGIALVEWFGREALRVYGRFSEAEGERAYRELIELIERKGGAITVRELLMARRSRYAKAEDATDALDGLIHDGLGEWERVEQGPDGGRPTKRFRLHAGADTKPPIRGR